VRIANLFCDESGSVAAEYAMLLAAVVVLVAIATGTLQGALSHVLRDAADCVEAGCL